MLTPNQGWHSCASACHRPFIFSLDAQVSTYAYHYTSTWTRMFSQWTENIPWKIIDNVPFFPPNYSNIELHVLKIAGELANRSKLKPIMSALSQDLLKRVFGHHQHDIDKVVAQCLLAGNYPSWSHWQNDMWVELLQIGMDPLKLVFYTFKGSKRPLLFGAQC